MTQKELSPYLKASSVDTKMEVAPSQEATSERKTKVEDNPLEARKKSSRLSILFEKIKLMTRRRKKYTKRKMKNSGLIEAL
jgi:hypothetical protein